MMKTLILCLNLESPTRNGVKYVMHKYRLIKLLNLINKRVLKPPIDIPDFAKFALLNIVL